MRTILLGYCENYILYAMKINLWDIYIHVLAIANSVATQYQKNKRPNQKVDRRPKLAFLQRRLQIANGHMKRCSALLIVIGWVFVLTYLDNFPLYFDACCIQKNTDMSLTVFKDCLTTWMVLPLRCIFIHNMLRCVFIHIILERK